MTVARITPALARLSNATYSPAEPLGDLIEAAANYLKASRAPSTLRAFPAIVNLQTVTDLPEGTVTFLFTDVEGSTRLWEDAPGAMMEALRQHDAAIDQAAEAHRGISVKPRGEGDSRFVVFSVATDAVTAAADTQRRLAEIDWATPRPLKVRVSLHTGIADLQLGDYYGSAVNRAARLRGIAHGGQTLMSGATWALVQDDLPDGVTAQDMGEHRLKDLTRPEHVYQINVVGLDDQFPPLDSLDTVPHNLPIQLTDFIGRPEIEDIKRIIGETRLLTIIAPGGAGKTRSAIQAAADLTGDYPDGVFFIDLAPVTSPKDIAQTTAEDIGVALATDEDLEAQLLAHLANDRQLLVFDNFEHLADGVGIVTSILAAAPDVKVIATSRTKLNVSGETVFALPGLVIDWDAPDEAFHASGVRLFIDAAKRADASFKLEFDDLDPLARILGLVDGMPLGILLAASWIDTLPVEEIATEISRSMDILETERLDVPDRQRSMRAVFDYSWSMLGDDERASYAALSAFRGGFSREAAEQVAGASLRSLSNLVGKSLVVADRDEARYSIHEQLREYAEAELAKDDSLSNETSLAHTSFYADLASAAADEVFGIAGDQAAGFVTVENDLDNIRLAYRQTLASGDGARARMLFFGLAYLYEIRGWLKAGSELFAEARAAFDQASGASAEIAGALAASYEAKFLNNIGQLEASAPIAEAAVDTLRQHQDKLALVTALEALCEIAIYHGDFDSIATLSTETIRVADEAGYEMMSAGMRNYRAGADVQRGDMDAALLALREGEVMLARLNDRFMRAWNLEFQGFIAMMEGRVDESVELRRRQIELAREVGYIRPMALGFLGLGQAYAASGRLEQANESLLEALRLFEHMGLVLEIAVVVVEIARVHAQLGATEKATTILSSVLAAPVSDQNFLFEDRMIGDAIAAELTEIEQASEIDAFAEARARGTALPLDVTVKELLTAS